MALNNAWLFVGWIYPRPLELLGRRTLVAFLVEKDSVDVGHHAASRDGGSADELVELLVVLDGQLDVARVDARLLVVLGGVAKDAWLMCARTYVSVNAYSFLPFFRRTAWMLGITSWQCRRG